MDLGKSHRRRHLPADTAETHCSFLLRASRAWSLDPLRWSALGPYEGALLQLLLKVRQPTKQKVLSVLVQMLSDSLSLPSTAMLVPIPSW